jgi:RNA polymerase sigma-70 factor (ECF subfamily)
MDHETTEQDMIARAAAGDDHSLQILLLGHYDRLVAHIAAKIPAYLRSTTDPEDLLQETFEQACRHIREFRPAGEGAFHAWLITIADRKLLDRIKSHNAQKRGGGQVAAKPAGAADSAAQLLDVLADGGDSPSQSVMRHENVQAVQVALATLPDDYRKCLRLCYIEGLPVAEVARRMIRSEHAVHMLCNRGKVMLKEVLGRSSQYFSSRR